MCFSRKHYGNQLRRNTVRIPLSDNQKNNNSSFGHPIGFDQEMNPFLRVTTTTSLFDKLYINFTMNLWKEAQWTFIQTLDEKLTHRRTLSSCTLSIQMNSNHQISNFCSSSYRDPRAPQPPSVFELYVVASSYGCRVSQIGRWGC